MSVIKNPNDIVDEFVHDYRGVFGNELLSVVMYGSAVTHEYRPGVSDINMAVVIADNSIGRINGCIAVQKKWGRRKLVAPYFMTPDYIRRSLDVYPIEFLDIQNSHRVLYGDDHFSKIDIKREHLRIQCERELKGAALHLRTDFIQYGMSKRLLHDLCVSSLRKLIPVFKALLVLGQRAIPGTKADIVSRVEESFGPGEMVLSEIFALQNQKPKRDYLQIFGSYVRVIDGLIETIDAMASEGS